MKELIIIFLLFVSVLLMFTLSAILFFARWMRTFIKTIKNVDDISNGIKMQLQFLEIGFWATLQSNYRRFRLSTLSWSKKCAKQIVEKSTDFENLLSLKTSSNGSIGSSYGVIIWQVILKKMYSFSFCLQLLTMGTKCRLYRSSMLFLKDVF